MKNSLMKLTGMLAIAAFLVMSCDTITDTVTDSEVESEFESTKIDRQLMPFAIPAGADIFWYQDFSEDTDGWFDKLNGWRGEIIQNPSTETATVKGEQLGCPGYVQSRGITDCYYGVFSPFDGYRLEWPGDYIADIDIYLDPNTVDFLDGRWGFDYIVASSKKNEDAHLRDFNFHVGFVDGELLVNGSNNSDFYTNEFKLLNDNNGNNFPITQAGWYTFQHSFYDDGGFLAVDLNLFDGNGELLWTATRNTADEIATDVGGNRYSWFTHVDAANGIEIDNHSLYQLVDEPTSMDDCKDGGFEQFGFRNQGQCIRYINTGKDSR